MGTDRFVLEENINSINATEKRQKLCVFTQNFTLLSLPMFLSIPAATAAKLGMKLGAGVSGLWHASLWYRLFMLGTLKAKTSKIHHQLSKFKSVCVCVCHFKRVGMAFFLWAEILQGFVTWIHNDLIKLYLAANTLKSCSLRSPSGSLFLESSYCTA